MVGGHRYAALVATIPERQRQGIGDAVMRFALEAARRTHGDCPSFLHATDAGRPVYERMGYKALAAHTVYIEKRLLEQH
jgi:predicted N-acetyltransferase YhbS